MPPSRFPRSRWSLGEAGTFGPCAAASGLEIALQRAHLEVSREISLDAERRGHSSGKSGVVRNFMQEGFAPEGARVLQRLGAFRGVEHELHLAVLDRVDDVR